MITFFATTVFLILLQLIDIKSAWIPIGESSPVRMHVVIVLIISAMATIFKVMTRSRLSAILSMGVLGYGMGTLFMFYGAVDLAITQFLVETVIMVIFIMVIYHLPRFAILSSKTTRLRDALIAAAVGITMTFVVLKARFVNLETPISGYFTENSFLEGHGRNIVNVILVDFRALDTLGEITVLALAAAGVYSLLRLDLDNKKPGK